MAVEFKDYYEVLHGSVRSVSLQRVNAGSGQPETQTFRVKIPDGVPEGQLISTCV
jgi:hypothetical protein